MGDAQTLLLTAAQMAAVLPDGMLVPLRKGRDLIVEVGQLRRFADVGVRDVVARRKADVVGDGPGDQVGCLGHEGHLASPLCVGQLADRATVGRHRACVGIPQTEQELHEGRLPATGRADDPDHLAGGMDRLRPFRTGWPG